MPDTASRWIWLEQPGAMSLGCLRSVARLKSQRCSTTRAQFGSAVLLPQPGAAEAAATCCLTLVIDIRLSGDAAGPQPIHTRDHEPGTVVDRLGDVVQSAKVAITQGRVT